MKRYGGEEHEQVAAPHHQSVRHHPEEHKEAFAMKKAVLYGRTSTPEQHLESQFIQLRDIAAQRGQVLSGVYSDFGVAGSKSRRPGIDSLLRDARRGKFSVILVYAFDRLATTLQNFLALVDEIDSLGIELIFAREAVDTSTPTGRMFVTTLGSIAQMQKSFTKERIKAGMRRRKLDGLPCGRQPLDIDHDDLVRDRLSGMSLTDVAKRYGVSRASVVRWVREAQPTNPALSTSYQLNREFREEVAA
jgi:DNA invertase Pin-like site-specific DNA recombinase